ncbi:MAG: WD40 repeat domain-containing protein, partial [Myxococcota bacterium]
SPGGEHLAVLDSSDRLHIREVRTGEFVLRVPKKQQGWKIYWGRDKDYVQWSPDGTLVFIGGYGSHMLGVPAYHMTVYSVGERQEVYTRLGLPQYNISWSPTQPRVFFEGGWVLDFEGRWVLDDRYSCIDVIAPSTVYSRQQDRSLECPRWSPNGRFIAGGHYNDMRVVDASNGDIAYDQRTQPPQDSRPVEFNGVRSWSPDSGFIAAACRDRISGQARVQVWRVADSGSLSFVHSLSVGCNIEAMAWNPQGTHLALLDHDGYLHVRGVHLPNAS